MTDRIVQAREPFSATVNGIPFMVTAGELYYAKDPLVKGREHLFRDLTVQSSGLGGEKNREFASVTGSATETATAEPGKRRYTRRARPEDTVEPTESEV